MQVPADDEAEADKATYSHSLKPAKDESICLADGSADSGNPVN